MDTIIDWLWDRYDNVYNLVHNLTHTHHEIMKPYVGKIIMCAGKWKWNYKGINFSIFPQMGERLSPRAYIIRDVNPEEQELIYNSDNMFQTYINIMNARREKAGDGKERLE